MATTKKKLTARVAAGAGAIALATIAMFGGALPASAAPNLDPDALGSITVHKFEQPAVAGERNDGRPVADTSGLDALEGVGFSIRELTGINLSTNPGWTAATGLTAGTVLDNPTAYPLGDVRTETTDEDGAAAFQNLPIGVYLVQETSPGDNRIALPAQPFLVSVPMPVDGNGWLYEVHVYPKNALTDISKTLDDTAARGLGDTVSWTIRTLVPRATEGNVIDSYVITDRLDENLRFTDAVVSVADVTLVEGRDYTLDVVDGLVTVEATPAALGFIEEGGGETISIVITTEVIGIGDGSITNAATLYINDPDMERGFVSNEQTSYWGAVRIVKQDSANERILLDGAIFEVRDAAGELVEVDGETRFETVDGEVVIPGLRTSLAGDTYTIVEVQAPTGYVLEETPVSVKVVAGTLTNAVVVEITNAQVPAYALPITGGSGQAAFMIGGFGLLAGALGFMLMRRRKAKAEALV